MNAAIALLVALAIAWGVSDTVLVWIAAVDPPPTLYEIVTAGGDIPP